MFIVYIALDESTHLSELCGAWVSLLCSAWCIGVKLYAFNSQSYVSQGFEVTHLSWIEKSEWVDGPLDGLHQLNRSVAELFVQVLFLSYTNTVFSGTCMTFSRLNLKQWM